MHLSRTHGGQEEGGERKQKEIRRNEKNLRADETFYLRETVIKMWAREDVR